jgi:hypothetical protein
MPDSQKPQVVYFTDNQEVVDRVISGLSRLFKVTPVMGETGINKALDILRDVKPDFVMIDPDLLTLDPQLFHQHIKADPSLSDVQFLLVQDEKLDLE